jgi:hypothetical protein
MRRRRISAFAIVGIIGMALILVACGSSGKTSSSPPSSASANTFVLSEFTIIPPTNTLGAGSLSLTANNVGAETHELVIVRATSAGTLPMKADGSVDEDKIPAADKVGEIQEVAARSRQTKTFDLTSGTYVAFCNIVETMMGSGTTVMGSDTTMMNGMGAGVGHVHFAKGMHVTFTVR